MNLDSLRSPKFRIYADAVTAQNKNRLKYAPSDIDPFIQWLPMWPPLRECGFWQLQGIWIPDY